MTVLWRSLAVVLGLSTLNATPACGSVFMVNSASDAVDATVGDGHCATAGGDCTLRAAVQEANALPGGDTVIVPQGTYLLTIEGIAEDDGVTGDLDIVDDYGGNLQDGYNLRITGAVAGAARDTIIDGNGIDRVIHIHSGRVLLKDLTIRGGNTTAYHFDPMRPLADEGEGGGIFADAGAPLLTVIDTIVTDNTSRHRGGGIYNYQARLEIRRSTVSRNRALRHDCEPDCINHPSNVGGEGGGIDNSCGELQLFNSTISGNEGQRYAGIASGKGTLANATIASNRGYFEVFGRYRASEECQDTEAPQLIVRNSIITGELGGRLISQDYNVLARNPDSRLFGGADNDRLGVEPKLDALLKNNGGSTDTHALQLGSPAIDGGNPLPPGSGGAACAAFDQRSQPRGPRCDIGAYEASCDRLSEGSLCEEGNACTTQEHCQPDHRCGGGQPPNCAGSDVCSVDGCDCRFGSQPLECRLNCGNGVLNDEAGEQCDQGPANGTPGSCCNTDCSPKLAGDICRPGDVCGIPERCDGTSGKCPLDVVMPDLASCTDGVECTVGDRCTGGVCAGDRVCSVDVTFISDSIVVKGDQIKVRQAPFKVTCELFGSARDNSCRAVGFIAKDANSTGTFPAPAIGEAGECRGTRITRSKTQIMQNDEGVTFLIRMNLKERRLVSKAIKQGTIITICTSIVAPDAPAPDTPALPPDVRHIRLVTCDSTAVTTNDRGHRKGPKQPTRVCGHFVD